MNKYKYADLHGKIIAKFGSLKAYAYALNICKNSLYYKLAGKTPWKYNEIIKSQELLSLSAEETEHLFLP